MGYRVKKEFEHKWRSMLYSRWAWVRVVNRKLRENHESEEYTVLKDKNGDEVHILTEDFNKYFEDVLYEIH